MAPPLRICRLAATVLLAPAVWADITEPPLQLPDFLVLGERVGALEVAVPHGELRPSSANLGPDLLTVPGVYGQSRAADATEPSIRGLGFDRVATTFNGLPLVNASPERTNSPIVILGSSAVTGILVAKALPSVTTGPVTTAGRIVLTSDPDTTERRDDSPATATLSATINGDRTGVAASGRYFAQAGGWSADATVFRNALGNYTAADGRQVAAHLDDEGGSAALGWRSETRRWRLDVLHRRLRRQDTLALPLDGKNTDSDVVTFTDQWTTPGSAALDSVAWHAGYATTDPYITSEDRPVPGLTFAQATSRSFGAGLMPIWRVGGVGTLAAGADYSWQDRRAVRTTATGRDFIWPDAVYTDAGGFGEWKQGIGGAWQLRLGGRVDEVRSDARDADQPALGRPLRQQFVAYNGPAAALTKRHDVVGATNIIIEWKHGSSVSAFVGAGLSAQPPPATERYRAFLNALGGDGRGGNAVELGNPSLASERKAAFELGATGQGGWLRVESTAYAYRVDNFILRKPIGATQPPLPRMPVFGYRNIDALFYGTELAATARAGEEWSFPVTFAVAEGRNTTSHRGLSELPPWDATGAARWRSTAHRMQLEVGARFAGAKSNPAPDENPLFLTTSGFSIWHLRAGFFSCERLRVEAGIENAFNREYTEYLAPPVGPVRPASGNLLPGDRIPAPGRAVWLSLTTTW